MTHEELIKSCQDNYVWIYTERDSRNFEGVPDYQFDEFLTLLQDYRKKYDKVEIECHDSGGAYSINPDPLFSLTGYSIAPDSVLESRLKDKLADNARKEQEDKDRQRSYDMANIKTLKGKYPELFK